MNQSMTSGLIWSVRADGVALPLAGYFPLVMGLEGLAAAAAHQYLMIELCVLPAVMVERVAVACLRGAGDMVSGLVVMAIVNVVNMVVSYSLCSGLGPAARMGWTGTFPLDRPFPSWHWGPGNDVSRGGNAVDGR